MRLKVSTLKRKRYKNDLEAHNKCINYQLNFHFYQEKWINRKFHFDEREKNQSTENLVVMCKKSINGKGKS